MITQKKSKTKSEDSDEISEPAQIGVKGEIPDHTENFIDERIEQGNESHFRLMIGETEILELIEKNKKRHFVFGPVKEELVSYGITLKPLFFAQVTTSKKTIFSRPKQEQTDVIFDAKSGEIIIFKKGKFIQVHDFSKIISFKENDIIILRYLTEKGRKIFPAEISIKTRIVKSSVTKSIKDLLKKRLVAYEKVGRDMKFFSILDLPETRIIQVRSDKPSLTKEKINASILKPSIMIKDIEKAVKCWFSDSLIVNSKVIYLPVYMIRYSGKNGIRKLEINGVTGKSIGLGPYQ